MTRSIVWQATLALVGIGLAFFILLNIQTETVATMEVPAAGGTYIEGVLGYSETINPILAPLTVPANPVDQDLGALVFEGLTTLDETGQISPSLALDWVLSGDGTVYEFQLREDVTWHDGAPFGAADVAFTVQAMQDPEYQGDPSIHELWHAVQVEQLDEYTVRFTLEEPFPSFLYYTTIGLLPAHLLGDVPAAELPTHPFSTQRPIGTGQFMVDSVSPDRVVLAVYPDYRGPETYLSGLELWFYADEKGLLIDHERGDVHGFHPESPETLSALAALPNLNVFSAPLASHGIVYLNLEDPTLTFFQEQEVRQALLYALDRQALIDLSLDGQGLVADSPIPPTLWAHDPSVRRYSYDPERAVGLLDASGWLDSDADRIRDKDGVALSFRLSAPDDPLMVAMAEEIARQWHEVGIDATVQPLTPALATHFVRDRVFQATLAEFALAADPDPYPLWHSTQAGDSGQNFAGFASEAADLVMEEIRSTTNTKRRLELYHGFQQIFTEEVPSLLIYQPVYVYGVSEEVRNVQLAPLLYARDRFRNIRDWYLETEEIEVSSDTGLDKTEE